MVLLVASLFMLGLTGCDLFNPEDIPEVCDDGFELVGTECVPIEDEGTAPVITLLGDATVTLAVGATYTDTGATATDAEDGTLTSSIVVNNPVDTSVAGTYTITYDVTDSDGEAATQVTRTVIVVEPGDNDPVISLLGDAVISINAGEAYNEPGAEATDLEDGDISGDIVISGTVNNLVGGTYTLTYEITDADGNMDSVTRTVIVVPADAEVLANYIVDNWDGSLQFLGLTMANMDFSEAMNLSFEVEFELTEDVDEVRSVYAMVTDQYLYEPTGIVMHRHMLVDVEGTTLELNIIVEEIDTGVHLYIEYRPILDVIGDEAPQVVDIASWVGFDDDWALFRLDESLENVVEVAVVKDMLVSLFFSEMGEQFFYETQEEIIEEAIGFDLNQYGVDLGQFIDLLIEEDFDGAELLLQGIQVEHIALHVDYLYIAWNLYDVFMMYETELAADGFDTSKLDMLDTASFDELTGMPVIHPELMPIDPLEMVGTVAFFESLTEEEIMSIINIIIKPMLEEAIFEGMIEDLEELDYEFEMLLTDYQEFLEEQWPEDSDPFVFADELAELQANGAYLYWQSLTWEERDIFHWAVDHHHVGWSVWNLRELDERGEEYFQAFYRHREEYDYWWLQSELYNFLGMPDVNQYIWDNYMFDMGVWFTGIEELGAIHWYHNLPEEEQNMLMDALHQPGYEGYHQAIFDIAHMAQRPWDYQWWFEYGDHMSLGVDHATHTVIELIHNHETHLQDEWGWDVPAVIDQIRLNQFGVIDWYMYEASYDQQMALREIAEWEWEDRFVWTLDQLDEIMYNEWGYYIFFGRNEEMHDVMYLEYEVISLLHMFDGYLMDMHGIDIYAWINDIEMNGLVFWYSEQLSPDDREVLNEISHMDYGWYRWPVEVLEMWFNGEQFELRLCNWEYCIHEEGMNEDLIELIQRNEGYLTDMGWDVPAVVQMIEDNGAMFWYYEYATEEDMELLEEIRDWQEYRYHLLWMLDDLQYEEEDLLNQLEAHETLLNDLGYDATAAIAFIETNGIQAFLLDELAVEDIELLMDAFVYPLVEELLQAIEDREVAEFFVALIFDNPHYDLLLDEIEPTPDFDPYDILDIDNLQANMLAIDFDALVLEIVDLEALLTAIYDGPVAYDTFVTDLATTAPNAALFLEVLAPAVEELQPFMIYVDDINYAFEGLSVFEDFFTAEYWLDESGMDVELDVTPEFYVTTSMEMNSIMYQLVVDDLLEDLNTYLSGFQTLPFPYDSDWECLDPMDDDCDDLELSNLMAILTQIGAIGINVTFDPADPTWMELQLDATDFLDVIVYKSNEWILDDPSYVPDNDQNIVNGVNVATFTLTMSEGGDIMMPAEEDVDDVNDIAYDAAKFTVAMFARDYLRELLWHYDEFPEELEDLITSGSAVYTLNEFPFIRTSAAFDNEMSTIGITVDLSNPLDPEVTFDVTLYWIDGTEALNGTVSLDDFQANFDEFNNLTGQAAWQAMIGIVNDDNFAITKVWLMLMLQEEDYDRHDDYGMEHR